jgi:outer membrane protein insertion porin family
MSQAPSAAPKATRQPGPGTLHSLTIQGNQRYKTEAIVGATGLKVGQPISVAAIEQARLQLQKSELFNDVTSRYRFSGTPPAYDLTFEVAENPQLFPVRFEGLKVSKAALQEYLSTHVPLYAEQIPGTEGVLRRYTAAVQAFVSKSEPEAKIKAIVSNDDPAQLTVVFMPDRPLPTISQVTVTGNEVIDSGTILRALNPVAIGVPYSDTRLQQILNGSVKPVYAAKGYAAVTFPKIESEPSTTNQGVNVKVQISDGPQFHFGSIRFRGSGLDQDEIRSTIPFKPGQVFNGKLIDDFRLTLQHNLRRKGLLDASVVTDSNDDDSKRVVNVTYSVTPGAVYTFAKLDIQGLDITTQPAIEKLWGEKPGQPFNPDYPDFFLKRVEEQNLFEHLADTTSDYTADSSSHNVTVHLYFKGGESRKEKDRKKQQDREHQTSDGSWSPYP